MNLVIDIGNTNTKSALFENGNLVAAYTDIPQLEAAISRHKPDRCIISETGSNPAVAGLLKSHHLPVIKFHPKLILPIVNRYETPETLGHDRLAGVIAAASLFPAQAVLKIDFGTCITFDLVNENGEYLGGCISPGLQMRLNAMHHFTQKLPQLCFDNNESPPLVAANTQQSILSGALLGTVLETDARINLYKQQFTNLNVVGTGGDCDWVAARMENRIFARPYLVLEGLNQILSLNAA